MFASNSRLKLCLLAVPFLLASCGSSGDASTAQPTTTLSVTVSALSKTSAAATDQMVIYALDDVQQLRSAAEKARAIEGKVPDGWSRSQHDPMRLLGAFPTLRLRPGLVLRAYLFRDQGGNGHGIIWALPADAPSPEPKAGARREDVPKPEGAIPIMGAIEGDGSPWSYLSASLLSREARAYGAARHGATWGVERILGADPWSAASCGGAYPIDPCSVKRSDWRWLQEKPTDWRPQVKLGAEAVTVTFHTHTGLGQNSIFRYVDVYRRGEYEPQTRVEQIAVAPGGFSY